MNVKELIAELEDCYDKDLEVGYDVSTTHVELLVGDDGSHPNSSSIMIPKPDWC